MSVLRFLFARAKAYRWPLALVSLLSILGTLSTLAIPWLAGNLLGGIVSDQEQSLYEVAGLLVLVVVVTALLRVASSLQTIAVSTRVHADMRLDLYDHLQRLPMAFHDRARHGDILALMTFEVARLSDFLTGTLVSTPATLLMAGGAIVFMFLIDPTLGLLIVAILALFFLMSKVVGRRLRDIGSAARAAEARVVSIAERDLEMLAATKAAGREERQSGAYGELVEAARMQIVAQMRIFAVLGPVAGLIAALAAVLILVTIGSDVGESRDPEELFSFLFYAALLTRPIGALADVYGKYQSAIGTFARLREILEEPQEEGYRAGDAVLTCEGGITFDAVGFAYNQREMVLKDASCVIRPGQTVALTGKNGAGKTTIGKLLLRFYDPQAGMIRIDGSDIRDLQIQHLRRLIGYVPQMPALFNGTVRENILFGTPDASQEALEAACQLAQASSFIASLTDGFETEIGDHGVRLSGGQRQRIALARALLQDPPILLLDEATSMYDRDGEVAFIEACKTALADRTVLLITHRRASLALADRVLKVENARITEIAAPDAR
ncbi:ABC transporter ATP-binding protein [Aurantiacibacter poecillastricola]|uniref:ABC transporter ATP-binding protein n=1 Tax=Aurantiacibacter poecillastricola TaxID=3064385 RepID=UPI00273F987E|nr:ABC transporter ATP-binding protein [Aurantiacibacter sp. 219JJ12-13]MDP5260720.1 ABC transporter ATP-binding protein [Aurantiacibacter sp. 219JJ12-13]